jgi:hypothetical protein
LFDRTLGEDVVKAIRPATNKAWVLGDDRFKRQIEEVLARQVALRPRGAIESPKSIAIGDGSIESDPIDPH